MTETVFSIIELKTAVLDYGTTGVSPLRGVLLLLMILLIATIPYLILFHSLRVEEDKTSVRAPEPFAKMIAWMHAHRHPHLLHH